MSVSLQKGQKVSLTKDNSGLDKVIIGLGWDQKKKSGGIFGFMQKQSEIDCDSAALMLQEGKLRSNEDVIFFHNLKHKSGSLQHMGDNLTGAGDGDDEQIMVELSKVPPQYDKIVMVVNIYQAAQRNQSFGQISNAFIRLVDAKGNKEMCKYILSESYEGMTAMIFGEIYRNGNEWKFNAIGQATQDQGLNELTKRYI